MWVMIDGDGSFELAVECNSSSQTPCIFRFHVIPCPRIAGLHVSRLLVLSVNHLSGAFPTTIGALTSLTYVRSALL